MTGPPKLPRADDPMVAALLARTDLPAQLRPAGAGRTSTAHLEGPHSEGPVSEGPVSEGSSCEGPVRVVCAVSGGADSTALLALAVAAGLDVTAAHVDHGLRPGSAGEADAVRALAQHWGASFLSLHAPVEAGPDLENRARIARHRALPAGTLFGHTADDQAETVLLRLLRGTGPGGLAAMRPDRHPLLGLRRHETEALCRHLGVEPLVDPTNSDPRFRRNRIRHEVLPLLAEIADRDVVPLLCRLASLAADQADALAEMVSTIDADDVGAIRALPRALASEVVRRRWCELTGGGPPPDSAAVSRVLSVARGTSVGCEVTGGWSVHRSSGRLHWSGPGGDGRTPGGESPPRD